MRAFAIYIKGVFALLSFALALEVQTANAAEVVELPPEELARESVTPIFDKNESVKNRVIVTEGSWDVGVFGGLAMTEPIFNVSKAGLQVYYHVSESHAFGLLLAKNSNGISSNGQLLQKDQTIDFSRAPQADLQAFLDYNLKMFYGKMSVTKWVNFNTILMTTASVGTIKYTHKMYPAFAVGLANKFYVTPAWAFRFDLRLIANNAPVPFVKQKMRETDPVPEYSEFPERMHYSTNLEFGISYLF